MLWPIRFKRPASEVMEENARALKAIQEKTPEGISMMENFKKCFGYVGENERKNIVLREVEQLHFSSFALDLIRRSIYSARGLNDTNIYSGPQKTHLE